MNEEKALFEIYCFVTNVKILFPLQSPILKNKADCALDFFTF